LHFGKPDRKNSKKTIFERGLVLEAGDLFVLGPRTNTLHRHAIVPVASEKVLKRDKNMKIQPRISLVARNIARHESLKTVQTRAEKSKAERARKRAKKNE
jgi:hypothetical protein